MTGPDAGGGADAGADAAPGAVTVRVLGGVEAELDGVPVPLPARMHRALLAVLALEAGRVVPVGAIVDALWGEAPPASATTTLQGYVAALRRALEPGRPARSPARLVVTRGAGYLLDVPPTAVDALAFEAAARAGAAALAAGSPTVALVHLEAALAGWRGEPVPELAGSPPVAPVLARLAERRESAAEDHAEALLAAGRAADAVAGLEQLVGADPLRERRQALLARALAATGRQGDALAALRRARRLLADELGLDPTSVLRDAEAAVLRPGPPPPPVPAGARPAKVHGEAAAALRERVAALHGGGGGVVVVAGAAGTGKSVLAGRVGDEAARAGLTVLRATCPDPGTAPGFWPLRRLLADMPGKAADAAREALAGAGASGTDGASAQFLVYDAVAAALHDAAGRGPVLLVLDDAHAADASTVAVLGLLGPDLARLPVLAVLVVREPLPPPALPVADLATRPGGSRVDLRALPAAELAAIGTTLLGAPPGDDLVAVVAERSGGVAFLAAGLFRAAAGAPDAAEAARAALPGGVLAWAAARVARLPEPAGRLLGLAALAGTEIDAPLLAAATGSDPLAVVRALDAAVAAGLLVDAGTLRFPHALTREAVARALAPGDRASLHLALADALPASPAAVVTHLLAAGGVVPPARVVEATRAAADAAIRGGAWAEAAAVLQRSVEALRADGGDDTAWQLLLELGAVRRGVGDTVGAYATFDEALALASRLGDEERLRTAAAAYGAVALWSSRPVGGHDGRLVATLERAVGTDGEGRADVAVLGALACELAYRDRVAAAGHAERAVRLARRLGDADVLMTALHHAWRANGVPWLAAEQLARDDEALALLGPGRSRLTELVLRLQRCTDLATLGRLRELERELTTCRLLAGEVRSPELTAQVCYAEAGTAMLLGQWDRAASLASAGAAEMRRTSRPDAAWSEVAARWGLLHAQGRLGELAAELGAAAEDPEFAWLRPAAALAVLDAGDPARARELAGRWFGPPPQDWTWMVHAACWAELAARTGTPDPGAVRDLLAPCTGLLAVGGSVLDCGGSVDALLAGLELRLGRLEEARGHALAALRQETELGLAGWRPRTVRLVDRVTAAGT